MQPLVGSTTRTFVGVWLLLIAIAAIVADETAKAPIFPDAVYCLVGAGTFTSVPANTVTTSWRVNPGGPDVPDGWTTTPEREVCVHETLWRGWMSRYEARFGPLKVPTFSVSTPKACHINGASQFAEWFNGSLMARPGLANAFGRCLDTISSFQDDFLRKLDAQASSATSRSVQLSLSERGKIIRSNLEGDRKSACLKITLASLGISKSPLPFIGDQLANLEGIFSNGPWQGASRSENLRAPDEVTQLANRKLSDLTPSGTVELAERMSFTDSKDIPAFLRDPIFLLPSAYGGNSSLMGFIQVPLLDEWVGSVTHSIECH